MRAWLIGAHRIEDRLPSGTGRILDIGCGNGASLAQLHALGYDPHGVDIDEQLREVAHASPFPIYIGTIEDAPYESHSFDIILANQLLEHIIDFQSFFKRLNELLNADGILIFSTPNANSIFRRLFGKKWLNWHLPFHRMLFTRRSLLKLSAQYGFTVEKIQTITPTTWTVHQLHALGTAPLRGQRNPYWCGPTARTSFVQRLFWLTLKIIFTPINRCVDLLRSGDCIIVTMRRRTL